ncbi:MAG: hypothetical protein R6W97_11540 [Thiobacillus sp.]
MTWLLLAANVAVAGFFVGRDYWPQAASEQTAPINVDRLSLRGQSGQAASEGQLLEGTTETSLCVEWRGLNREEFERVRDQLKNMTGEQVMSFTEMPVSTRHWVIFPPLPSTDSASAKLSELLAAGFKDAFLVSDAPWRNAISLGLYANAESARRRVSEIEAKGVLGTRVELLPRQGTDFYFVIRSDDLDALKSLGEIKQPYPNSRQSRIACPS